MLLSKCTVSNGKKLKFIKEQEARELLSSLGIRTPLRQVSLLGPILFKKYKMKEIINSFLLLGEMHARKFMPEMHLKQPGFTYRACGPFTKKENFTGIGDSRYIYQNELEKVCFST